MFAVHRILFGEPMGSSRSLSERDAKRLGAGSRHYTAYVGPPEQYDFMGATQFRLLCTLGLREKHRLLDFGCGSLRAGRLLIPYLSPGCYHGLEPNRWLIDDAIERQLGRDLIEIKRPVFRHESDFGADGFGIEFDFIVAQSIFSHAGPDIIATALESFRRCLKPDGLIVATLIDDATEGDEFNGSGWVYPGCVEYRPEQVISFIQSAGLYGGPIPWFHPRQTWYVIARSQRELPSVAEAVHLLGAVLRDPDLTESVAPARPIGPLGDLPAWQYRRRGYLRRLRKAASLLLP